MADIDSASSSPHPLPGNEQLHEQVARDALAAVVVFLVALPLCMGVAIASALPIAAGLITGIVGGIVVGILAGSPLQVSGPAAGLTVIVFQHVQQYGYASLGPALLIAGLIQLVAGSLKLGQWFRAVSPAVIHGMLAGIGVLIFSSQFHVMVDSMPRKSGLANIAAIPESLGEGLPLPAFASTGERQLQKSLVAELRSLSQRQTILAKEIAPAKQTGHNAPGEEEAAPPAIPAERLPELLAVQQQIHDRLEHLSGDMRTFAFTQPPERAASLAEANSRAVRENDAALAALGDPTDVSHIRQTQQAASASLNDLFARHRSHDWAAKLGKLTILVIVLWQVFIPKKMKLIPGPLVAIVLATGLAFALSLPVVYVDIPDNLFAGVSWPSLATFTQLSPGVLLQAGLVLAFVASAETLLCATAVDKLHTGPRTNYDKELFAQGVGNTICGLLNALPMTGVIVRSSANVQAGGRTRLSTILHGVWLLVFAVGCGPLLRMIPTSSLAAILVYTGFKLVNFKVIKELKKYGWSEVGIYGVTVAIIVIEDLLTGVIVGILLSALKLLYVFSRLEARLTVSPAESTAKLHLVGAATFLRLPLLASELERVPPQFELHVDMDGLDYIDHACLELLMNWAKQHETTGGQLVIDWESLHARFRGNRAER